MRTSHGIVSTACCSCDTTAIMAGFSLACSAITCSSSAEVWPSGCTPLPRGRCNAAERSYESWDGLYARRALWFAQQKRSRLHKSEWPAQHHLPVQNRHCNFAKVQSHQVCSTRCCTSSMSLSLPHLASRQRLVVGCNLHAAAGGLDEALVLDHIGAHAAGARKLIGGHIGMLAQPPGGHPLKGQPGGVLARCTCQHIHGSTCRTSKVA